MPFFHANEYKVLLYIILSNIINKIEVVPLLSPSVPRSQPLRRSPSLPDPPLIDWEMYVILKNVYFHAEFMLFFSIFHLQKLAHYCGYLWNNIVPWEEMTLFRTTIHIKLIRLLFRCVCQYLLYRNPVDEKLVVSRMIDVLYVKSN